MVGLATEGLAANVQAPAGPSQGEEFAPFSGGRFRGVNCNSSGSAFRFSRSGAWTKERAASDKRRKAREYGGRSCTRKL
jgi:hypothetical protein